ncbi:hypothetical protein MJO28_003390 [Puccinia striiformis f. sp. tritici]|uniref:Uncharacterized protein n=1 Tax=Puccinia striiformis f. sp. tritici TaxID=168172 RepID=A0ACC0ET16_9BASI|nr:hypothetical protein MJO28_003390 [Puccinia striiformis f. sp. tritici]
MAPENPHINAGEHEILDAVAGYATDQSQTQSQLRRSSRASSVAAAPNMVAPSSDSRVRVNRPATGPPKRSAACSSDGESVQSVASARSKRTKKKPRTRGSPARTTDKTDKSRSKTKKSKGTSVASELQSNGATEPVYDYDQDSDNNSIEIQPRGDDKTKKAAKEAETAELLRYFEAPFWKKGDTPGTALNFKCKWCRGVYRRQKLSHGNLKTHRDGSTQEDKCDKGCAGRNKAKKAGFTLPPSVAERRALEAKDGANATQQGIKGFLECKPVFVNRVLNQIIMIWQIRQALPWSRIEDPFLRAAFQYTNSKAQLYGRRWSADESKKLYDMLKSHVFHELDNLSTKFTLIHDVWTTKGNRFAFIGAAAAFINDDWEYTVRHLTLKMIPWKHNGHLLARPIATLLKKKQLYKKISLKTTDSGSNNNTMASEMYSLLLGNDVNTTDGSNWDPTSMHIQCICHKFALIVNAGLASLALKTLPPAKAKDSVLGFFPVLGRLIEEDDEEETGPSQPVQAPGDSVVTATSDSLGTNVESDSDYGNADDEGSDDDVPNAKASDHSDSSGEEASVAEKTTTPAATTTASTNKYVKTSKLLELTNKLDVVIKQITRSAAQRANFDCVAQELGVKVAPLIAGYGIRWNIKYQSHKKAIDAREVIDQILKEDQHENGPGDFGEAYFSPRDWKEIDNLNRELEVFVKLTSEMEGNSATGTHVIPKYLDLKEGLTEKISASKETESLYPMYNAMLKKVERYLDEAVRCETLVMATIMHPCYRVHLFELGYGVESNEASDALKLLKRHFDLVKLSTKVPEINPDPDVIEIAKPPPVQSSSILGCLTSRMTQQPTAQEDEIEAYLKADIHFSADDLDHKTTPLKWWKANHKTYPTLAILARRYLGAAGSSCSVERLFSAASDVCSSNRGKLLPSTMSHCVSSLMWLREDIPLTGDFIQAGNALKALIPSKKRLL